MVIPTEWETWRFTLTSFVDSDGNDIEWGDVNSWPAACWLAKRNEAVPAI